jgi:N-acyl-D-amino-acid deacylase
MLSWSTDSLIADSRSQGEIRQGVTLEVMGGQLDGPAHRDEAPRGRAAGHHTITWTTLAGYLAFLEKGRLDERGLVHRGGDDPQAWSGSTIARRRPPSSKMRALVRQEMQAGALGIGRPSSMHPAPTPRPKS